VQAAYTHSKIDRISKTGNLEELDFCGANVSDIARFKSGYGFTIKGIFSNSYYIIGLIWITLLI
jgi:hypothetical protein